MHFMTFFTSTLVIIFRRSFYIFRLFCHVSYVKSNNKYIQQSLISMNIIFFIYILIGSQHKIYLQTNSKFSMHLRYVFSAAFNRGVQTIAFDTAHCSETSAVARHYVTFKIHRFNSIQRSMPQLNAAEKMYTLKC